MGNSSFGAGVNVNSTQSAFSFAESVFTTIFGQDKSHLNPNLYLNMPLWLWDIIKLYIITGLIFFSTRNYKKLRAITTICEIVFCFLTILFATPFVLLTLALNLIVRQIIHEHFRQANERSSPNDTKLELMNGNDAFWAYDEFANSCNFTNYLVMKGHCDVREIRRRIYENVVNRNVNGDMIYGKLRKRSIKKFGYFCWEQDNRFDVNYHVRCLVESNPSQPLTEDQVFDEIQKVIDFPLPKEHPQWQLLLVPHYIYNDPAKALAGETYFGLIIRMHHSYMDGISGGSIIQNAFADKPPKLAVDPLKPIHIPLGLKILSYASMVILGPRSFFRTLLLEETNCFHGKALTGPKTLSWSRAISLDALKEIRIRTKTTTTAIFVSAIGTALRNLALKKKFTVPRLVHGFQTVAMLPYPNLKPHNRFAVALLPMTLDSISSIERLHCTYRAYKELEQAPDVLISFLTMKVAGLLPRVATKFLSDLAHATILISNVPGPSESCSVFGGNELMELSAWAPIRCGIGMGVGFFSYNGKVRACVIADASCLNDPTDVSTIINEFEKEIIELGSYSDVPNKNIFV